MQNSQACHGMIHLRLSHFNQPGRRKARADSEAWNWGCGDLHFRTSFPSFTAFPQPIIEISVPMTRRKQTQEYLGHPIEDRFASPERFVT